MLHCIFKQHKIHGCIELIVAVQRLFQGGPECRPVGNRSIEGILTLGIVEIKKGLFFFLQCLEDSKNNNHDIEVNVVIRRFKKVIDSVFQNLHRTSKFSFTLSTWSLWKRCRSVTSISLSEYTLLHSCNHTEARSVPSFIISGSQNRMP